MALVPASSRIGVSRSQIQSAAKGLQSEPFPALLNPAAQAPASQTLYGCLNAANAGDTVTNVVVVVAQLAVGAVPTEARVALYSTAGVQLATSADLKSSSIWTAALGPVSAPLSTPYTFAADTAFYACLWFNGVFGGTVLNVMRTTSNAYAQLAYGANAPQHVIQTGQASLPTPATFVTTSALTLWLATS